MSPLEEMARLPRSRILVVGKTRVGNLSSHGERAFRDREYVCPNRNKEEQETREKMSKGDYWD